MSSRYNAADIEVLSGLDPVKRRPGMYTDTTRPNHMAQEVVDNSVDEALGFLAHTLTNKLLHHPSARLREAALSGDLDLLHAAGRLYDLDPQDPDL